MRLVAYRERNKVVCTCPLSVVEAFLCQAPIFVR